jgi:hypothetical protein
MIQHLVSACGLGSGSGLAEQRLEPGEELLLVAFTAVVPGERVTNGAKVCPGPDAPPWTLARR